MKPFSQELLGNRAEIRPCSCSAALCISPPPRKFVERVQRFTSRPCPACDSVNVSISTGEISVTCWDRKYESKAAPTQDHLRGRALASVFAHADLKVSRARCDDNDGLIRSERKTYQMITRGSWRDGICGVTEHLSRICQRCGGLKHRDLLRSDPNRIPERSGH